MHRADLHSQLLDMAQRKAESIRSHFPEVKAIIVTGSVAAGDVYPTSDIDLIAYVDGPIPAQIKHRVEHVEHGTIIASTGEVLAVNYRIGEIKCEVVYFSEAFVCRKLDSVLLDYEISLNPQTVASGIVKSKILYDPSGLIEHWKERLSHYPEDLAIAMIKSNLDFVPEPVLRSSYMERRDLLCLIEGKLRNQEKLLAILCGLNHIYHPGKWKSIDKVFEQMRIKLLGLGDRMKQIWETSEGNSINLLSQLIHETFDLKPGIDTTSARLNFERFW
ncbi:nucleotidyltransferase domain-containing protein [Neobacillus mesonae]|nr:nucleotidyltransferase domain-containing protein [Neobacillus mesonae]